MSSDTEPKKPDSPKPEGSQSEEQPTPSSPKATDRGLFSRLTPFRLLLILTLFMLGTTLFQRANVISAYWNLTGIENTDIDTQLKQLGAAWESVADENDPAALSIKKEILKGRGDLFSQEKRYKEAVVDYKKLTDLAPEYALGWISLAESQIHLDERDEAIKSLKSGLPYVSPVDKISLNQAGYVMSVLELDPEEALKKLEQCIELVNDSLRDTRDGTAVRKVIFVNWDRSLDIIQNQPAKDWKPNDFVINGNSNKRELSLYLREYASYLDSRGFAKYQVGRLKDPDNKEELFKEALVDLNSAIKLKTRGEEWTDEAFEGEKIPEKILTARKEGLAIITYHRGLILEALEKKEEAEADFKAVKELGFEPGPHLF